jgi:hypothetical protein
VDSIHEFIFRNAAEGILIVNRFGEIIHINPTNVWDAPLVIYSMAIPN